MMGNPLRYDCDRQTDIKQQNVLRYVCALQKRRAVNDGRNLWPSRWVNSQHRIDHRIKFYSRTPEGRSFCPYSKSIIRLEYIRGE